MTALLAVKRCFSAKSVRGGARISQQWAKFDSKGASSLLAVSETRLHSTIPVEAPATETTVPQLKEVKALPFVGSVLPFYSDVPATIEQPFAFWPEMRRRHGDFYTMGLPSMGDKSDSRSIVHIVTDPKEMFKVVRSGGAYPSGLISSFWPNIKWSKDNKLALVDGDENGLFGQGEDWKRLRTFLQTDLLHPEAARGYIPGMLQASQLASKGAPASSEELNNYLSRVSFDLFSTIMFGEYTKTADKTVPADPENIKFVNGTIQGLSNAIQILFDPYETVMGNVLNMRTKKYQTMSDGLDIAWDIGCKKVNAFLERLKRNELTENEKASYLARAIERQATEKSNVSVQEVIELAWTGLFAAVDTTSAALGWNLVNLAMNPQVQDKLHAEVESVVAANDGVLTETSYSKDSMPYLHAVIRESHRLTPSSAIAVMKTVGSDEIEIHGKKLNKGAVVALENYSLGIDPQFMDEPEKYKPERWLPDAVAARAGTPAQVLDHPFLKEPFSQGPRRCPGSRVATNEMLVFLSQLVLDWKITSPTVTSLKDIKYEQRTSIEAEIPPMKFEPRH